MENKHLIGIIIGAVIILIAGALIINKVFLNTSQEAVALGGSQAAQEENFNGNTQYVDITANGFSVERVQIFQGDRIVWRNLDISPHRIVSNYHPSHNLYPESGGCGGSAFDSCDSIAPGKNWTFIFNKVGIWGYHDENNLQNTGSVVVKVK